MFIYAMRTVENILCFQRSLTHTLSRNDMMNTGTHKYLWPLKHINLSSSHDAQNDKFTGEQE